MLGSVVTRRRSCPNCVRALTAETTFIMRADFRMMDTLLN
jgi:hypothetical protein